MTEEIRDLLDELSTAVAHIENDQYHRVPFWTAERDSIAMALGRAWARETADTAE